MGTNPSNIIFRPILHATHPVMQQDVAAPNMSRDSIREHSFFVIVKSLLSSRYLALAKDVQPKAVPTEKAGRLAVVKKKKYD